MQIYWIKRLSMVVLVAAVGACAGNGAVNQPNASSNATGGQSQSAAKSVYQDAPDRNGSRSEDLAIGLKKFNAVDKILRDKIRQNPQDLTALLQLAVLYREVEKFDQAHRVLQQALTMTDNSPQVLNELGILQRAQGNFVKAQSTYVSILAAAPDFHDAHFNLGILYDLYLRQPNKAQNHYQTYLDNAPEADARVEKWLVDLSRRTQADASASARITGQVVGNERGAISSE